MKHPRLLVAGIGLLVLAVSSFPTLAQGPSVETKLTASDAATFDLFGRNVALSGDPAVVGAVLDDDAGSFSGSAYVFVRSGTTWSEQAKLTASDGAAADFFGRSVAVSGDTAVIGAERDNDAGTNSGSAYVFVRSGTTWSEQAKLTASGAAAGDLFGFSVAVSGDTAVVGAPLGDGAVINSGAAYAFELAPLVLQILSELQAIVDSNAGTLLADKVEDAVANLETAVAELAKTPPDNQAAVGNIEGAVGDLEVAVNLGLLDPSEGTAIMNQLAGVARQLAAQAIADAVAQGGDPVVINDAQQSLAAGDGLRSSGLFKDAVNQYKDALANAESA